MWPAAIGNLLVLAAVVVLFAPVAPRPWGWRMGGHVLRVERLSLLGRLRMWGRQVAAVAVLAAAGWRLGVVSDWAFGLALAAVAVALLCPVRYTVSTLGIRAGLAPVRRWTEFGGVARRRWGVQLQGVAGNPGAVIWLSGAHGDDEFVLLMRRLVRGAWKGQPDAMPGEEPGPHRALAAAVRPLAQAAAPRGDGRSSVS